MKLATVVSTMRRRLTIAIDEELLRRAKQALGEKTLRGTVEKALRQATEAVANEDAERPLRQRRYLEQLKGSADAAVIQSEDMWR